MRDKGRSMGRTGSQVQVQTFKSHDNVSFNHHFVQMTAPSVISLVLLLTRLKQKATSGQNTIIE